MIRNLNYGIMYVLLNDQKWEFKKIKTAIGVEFPNGIMMNKISEVMQGNENTKKKMKTRSVKQLSYK